MLWLTKIEVGPVTVDNTVDACIPGAVPTDSTADVVAEVLVAAAEDWGAELDTAELDVLLATAWAATLAASC